MTRQHGARYDNVLSGIPETASNLRLVASGLDAVADRLEYFSGVDDDG